MSAVPAPEPRPQPAGTTREQLDELDALLQRMLDLPVEPSGDDRQESEDAARGAAPVAEAPVSLEAPAPEPPERPPATPTPPRQVRLPAVPEPPPVAAAGPAVPVSRPTGDRAPVWLRLLVWGNQLFDRGAGRLGAPGHWLRRPLGRAVLGWTGLALLALALGVVLLDWIGWPW
jgi:hypothetical protein